MTTTVPAIQFNPTGVVLPSESDILNGVQADMNAAVGGNLSPTLTSPQGQLAQSLAAIVGDKNDEIANISNQVDPDQASGRFQDALGLIYFMTRNPAIPTAVACNCVGLAGTVIPQGALVQDANGNQYAATAAATIPTAGTVSVQFVAVVPGPTAVAAGAVSQIYQAIPGWESVTNPAPGVTGADVEDRTDFEFRRRNSVAINAQGSPQSILAALLATANVTDAYVVDNPSNVAVTMGTTNYSVAPNSVYIAVAGAAAQADIAQAIWNKKSLGCSYNGNTSYTIQDDVNYQAPYPQYVVTWETPTPVPIYVTVNIASGPGLPNNIVQQVQAAVTAAFTGTDGGQRARIGSTIYAGRFYAGIAAIPGTIEIVSVTVGQTASPTGASTTLGIDQAPTLATSNIVVNLS